MEQLNIEGKRSGEGFVAQGLINKGKVVSEGLLNMVEMAFRAYDPCMACATHCLPGQMPLEVVIYNDKREVIERLRRL